MAGGQGTRFWPYSTPEMPKQFLNIAGNGTLIKQTFDRLSKFLVKEDIYVVADEKYRELTLKSIPGFSESNYIVEPSPKNTAPCLMLANIILSKHGIESNLLVVPADHYIPDSDVFSNQMKKALEMADKRNIITSGIKPSSPHTGYGYIKFDNDDSFEVNGTKFYKVSEFKEKPSLKVAERYIKEGNYFWNSGMFIYKLKYFREFLKEYSSDYFLKYEELEETVGDRLKFNDIYNGIKPDSIDYVLMEKAKEVRMFGAEFSWNDVGSWSSVYQLREKDINGNVDNGNNILINTKNSMVYSNLGIPIAVLGLEDIVVIGTKDGILVSDKKDLQRVKDVVGELKERKSKKE